MPKLSGVALLKAKSEGGSTGGSTGRKPGTFTPLFRLKEVGDSAYIKFVREELEEVFLHTFVRVPAKSADRAYNFEHFASRSRNVEFDDDYSLLEEELDHWPQKKIAAIAVLLDPVYDGKGQQLKNITGLEVQGNSVERDDGTTLFYPNWQLIFEAYGTFWENLVVISNNYGLAEYPLQVTKVAKDSYQFLPLMNHSVEIDEERVPTIKAEILRLGSQERYNEYFGAGKPRLPQEQKHMWLPEWLQKERKAKLAEKGVVDESETTDDVVDEVSEAPVPRQAKKRRVSFDDIETDDTKEEIEPYTV